MIRLSSINLDAVTPRTLPAPEARPDGPVRALFISATFLGFGNYHQAMMEHCRSRTDLDAVFIELRPPLWLKVLAKQWPGHYGNRDYHTWRYAQLWRRVIGRWLRGPLRGRFDVVHLMTQNDAWAVLDLPPDVAPAVAVNIDVTAVQAVRELGGSPRGLAPVIEIERRLFDRANLVVCRNNWCACSLSVEQGIAPDKILLARNSLVLPSCSRLDRPIGPVGRLPRIVIVGNDFVRKGGRDLLAVHQRDLADRAELHICSSHAELDAGLRNVVHHRATPRAQLLGGLLAEMDVFCMPTHFDIQPWAVLEAAASALPVVSSRLAGISEVVQEGRTGFLVEPGDHRGLGQALMKLLEDPGLRRSMGEQGRRRVGEEFDPARSFTRLMDRLWEIGRARRDRLGRAASAPAGRA